MAKRKLSAMDQGTLVRLSVYSSIYIFLQFIIWDSESIVVCFWLPSRVFFFFFVILKRILMKIKYLGRGVFGIT
ncbi:hypothetical protein LguiA_012733 [Lonicera macranthoides]